MDMNNVNSFPKIAWHLKDDTGKPVCTFIPIVLAAINLEQHVRLVLELMTGRQKRLITGRSFVNSTKTMVSVWRMT